MLVFATDPPPLPPGGPMNGTDTPVVDDEGFEYENDLLGLLDTNDDE